MHQRGLTALVLFFHCDSVTASDVPSGLYVLHEFLSPRGQNRLFCLRHWILVCKYDIAAHVRLFLNCYGGRSWAFALVVGFTCVNKAFLPPSSFIDIDPNCGSSCGKSSLSSGCFAIRCVLCRCSVPPHRPIAVSSHKSLRKRLRGYVLTGLLLFEKTEQPEIHAAGESVDS